MSARRKEKLPDWVVAWHASANDPLRFAIDVMGFLPPGVPNPNDHHQLEQWQFEFLRDFYLDPEGKPTDSPRHTVRAGHGVGKGVVIAILALWFPSTHFDSKSVLTANSQDQLRDNNWPEIRKWATKLPDGLRDQIQIDEEKLYIKAQPEMAFVVRRTASKSNPEALQGIHAKHVLYLVDEASGIIDQVFEAAQGSLSTKGAAACLFSNPTRSTGFFHDTHNKLRARWRTKVVSSEDVPRAQGHIQEIIDGYGKTSNRYRVRVLGQFPNKDDDTVMPLQLVEAAKGRNVEVKAVRPLWGVDVGRFGDDASALAKRKGNVLLEPVKEWMGKDTMQLVGIIVAEWYATHEDLRPSHIMVDVIGIGSGVVDRLKEIDLGDTVIVGVNVAEAQAVNVKYHRLRDELWWKGREWFESLSTRIPTDDEKLISELTVVTYDFHSEGGIVVESKKSLRKRQVPSPNKADAFLLTFARTEQRQESAINDRHRRRPRRSSWAS